MHKNLGLGFFSIRLNYLLNRVSSVVFSPLTRPSRCPHCVNAYVLRGETVLDGVLFFTDMKWNSRRLNG